MTLQWLALIGGVALVLFGLQDLLADRAGKAVLQIALGFFMAFVGAPDATAQAFAYVEPQIEAFSAWLDGLTGAGPAQPPRSP